MPQPGWYYRLSRFFREKFGEKVYKIPLAAGLNCPNRDGTLSWEGCIYCYNPGFSPAALNREREGLKASIAEQIAHFQLRSEKGREGITDPASLALSERFQPRRKYLAYFQSYSNTYAPVSALKELYEEALKVPGIVGLSIATRPDCLEDDVLALLQDYAREYHIWLELGLQSAHDQTLQLINRGHTLSCFQDAVQRSAGRGIFICVHIINGLPGEDRPQMLQTAAVLRELPINGIKFHQLQLMENTTLAKMAVRKNAIEEKLSLLKSADKPDRKELTSGKSAKSVKSERPERPEKGGAKICPAMLQAGGEEGNIILQGELSPRRWRVKLLSLEEYLSIVCDQLEILRADIAVHRLLSEVTEEFLIAPRWDISRPQFARMVEEELCRRGSHQGSQKESPLMFS